MVLEDSIFRQVAIAVGTGLTLLTIPLSLVHFRFTQRLWIQLTAMAIVMGLMEFACQWYLIDQDGIEKPALRLIAYGYAITGWLLGAVSSPRENSIPMPLQWLAVVMALVAGAVWIQLSFSSSSQGSRFSASEDLHPVGLGLLFGTSACTCFGLMFTSAWYTLRIAMLPACLAMMGCMLTTGSRGSMLALAVACLIVGLSRMQNVKSFVGISVLASAVVVLGIAATLFVPEVREQFNYIFERFSRIGEGDVDPALMERTEIRSYYTNKISEWIWLGCDNYDMTRYPHNIFLELIVRFGIVLGGVVSIAIVYSAVQSLKWLFTDPRSNSDALSVIITFLGLFGLIVAQFNLALEFSRVLWMATGYWLARPNIGKR